MIPLNVLFFFFKNCLIQSN
uniref:Uncharacterized protein n=1 Tax=Anguilla anguilla TaxID=7936 RepID=A0A0E9XAC0_ANGAN